MSELYLAHHGIKGQKWGVRRFENEDGTLTAAGKKRYQAQEAYVKSYNKYKEAKKFKRSDFKIGGMANRNARIRTAEAEKDVKKADYLYSKAKTDKGGERARNRQITKAYNSAGAIGILSNKVDTAFGGSYRQKLSKNIEKTYGKEYADKQIKKAKNLAVASIAATTAYYVGKKALNVYLKNGGAEQIGRLIGKGANAYRDKRMGIIPDDKKWREIPNIAGSLTYKR
jgi:hypothetical protein